MEKDKRDLEKSSIDWDAIDARIAAYLEQERKRICEVIAGALGEVAEKNEQAAKDLRIQFEKLDSLFTEWRRCLKAEGMPPPPLTPTQIN